MCVCVCDQVHDDMFDNIHQANDFQSSSFACMMFSQLLAVRVAVKEKTSVGLDRTLTFLIVCHTVTNHY